MKTTYYVMAVVCAGLALGCVCSAGDTNEFKDRVAVLAVRSMLKGYISAVDFEAARARAVADMRAMPPAEFAKLYERAWDFLRQCPQIVARYSLRPNMKRDEAAKIVAALERRDWLNSVDMIPDRVLADYAGVLGAAICAPGAMPQDAPQ